MRSVWILLLFGSLITYHCFTTVSGEEVPSTEPPPSFDQCKPYVDAALKTGSSPTSDAQESSSSSTPNAQDAPPGPEEEDDDDKSSEQASVEDDDKSKEKDDDDSKEAQDLKEDGDSKEDADSKEDGQDSKEDDEESAQEEDATTTEDDSKEEGGASDEVKEDASTEQDSKEEGDEKSEEEESDAIASTEDESKEGDSKEGEADSGEEESKEDANAASDEENADDKTKEDEESKEEDGTTEATSDEDKAEDERSTDGDSAEDSGEENKSDATDGSISGNVADQTDDSESTEDNQTQETQEDQDSTEDASATKTEAAVSEEDGKSGEEDDKSGEEDDKSGEDDKSEETQADEGKAEEGDDSKSVEEKVEESDEKSGEEEEKSEETATITEAETDDSKSEEEKSDEVDEKSAEGESEEGGEKKAEEAKSDDEKSEETESDEESAEDDEDEDGVEEAYEPRSRDHITEILGLDDSDKTKNTYSLLDKATQGTLKDLKRIYENAIKPLETLYKYRDLSNRHFGDPEIFSKPLVVFMGPWSGGKSTIINWLLDIKDDETALRTGADPSPAQFNIMMYGKEEEVLDGTQLAADWTFSGLQKFGQSFLDRLRGRKLPNRLLEKVNIVEIPGILEVRKQVERSFPFNDACQWFIDRADVLFLVYDPAKLDIGPETEAILDQLKGRENQVRIVLNKADSVKPDELLRVQAMLVWNISPLMSSAEPPVMYAASLWDRPLKPESPKSLLTIHENSFLKDIRDGIEKQVETRIAAARRFAVRVRNHAKMVDCYLNTYNNHRSFFSDKKKISNDIIDHPQNYHIYEGLSTLTNISRYDLPDPDTYRDFFKLNHLWDFPSLSSTCSYFRGCPINKLDIAIAYELPEVLGKFRRQREAIFTAQAQKSPSNNKN